MVTIIHPAGFDIGVFTTGVALAAIEPRRAFGFAPSIPGLVLTPAREQLIVSTMQKGRRVA
jgi:hypothetical protein